MSTRTRAPAAAPALTEAESAPPLADAPPAADELRLIALERIVPSALNPRKTFDPAGLEQLAKSIREKGVLEPIIVRPRTLWQQACGFVARQRARVDSDEGNYGVHKHQFEEAGIALSQEQYDDAMDLLAEENRIERNGNGWKPAPGAYLPVSVPPARYADLADARHYQIVCGERRVRAARLAGLAVIPAIVREMDDLAAAECAVVENDQREDVPPLEQAEGYAELVRLGDDVETIAAKIGRPLKYVIGRLQLTHLVEELKDDLRTGKLPFGHAWLLSRLPAAEQTALSTSGQWDASDLYNHDGQPVALDKLKRRIKEGFLGCLSAAPWKKDDEQLVPAAGSCDKCPKRTGANPTLFDELLNGDAKKGRDYCTDRGCYAQKRDAFVHLQVKKATDGAAGTAPLKVSTGWHSRDKEVLDKTQYDLVSAKEAKKAKPGELTTAVVVAGDEDVGKIVQVRVRKRGASSSAADASYQRREAERRKKAEAGGTAAVAACGAVAEAIAAACKKGLPSADVLHVFVAQLIEALWADASRIVARRRKLGKGVPRDLLTKHAQTLDSAPELLALAFELVAAKTAGFWGSANYSGAQGRDELAFWKEFGIDRAKLVKRALAAKSGALTDDEHDEKPAAARRPRPSWRSRRGSRSRRST